MAENFHTAHFQIRTIKPKVYHGQYCCVPGCTSNAASEPKPTFHRFPKCKQQTLQWAKLINRRGNDGKFSLWMPGIHDKICGFHFNKSGRRKYENKSPLYFPGRILKTAEQAESTINHTSQPKGKAFRYFENDIIPIENDDIASDITIDDRKNLDDDAFNTSMVPIDHQPLNIDDTTTSSFIEGDNGVDFSDHSYSACMSAALTNHTIEELRDALDKSLKKNIYLESQVDALTVEKELLQNEVEKSKLSIKDLEFHNKEVCGLLIQANLDKDTISRNALKGALTADALLKKVTKNESLLKLYTGFVNYDLYHAFSKFVEPGFIDAHQNSRVHPERKDGRRQTLNFNVQLLMILMRLRLALLEGDLAARFGVSVGTVSNICSFWINFLSSHLVTVALRPSQYLTDKFMTCVILDCTEIFIEYPVDLRLQSETGSSNESLNVTKGVLGITPNGFISFVSDLFPGRTSDKELAECCGIVDKNEPGDSVMAAKGFIIEDILCRKGATLSIPSFFCGQNRLYASDESKTRDNAHLRIHVERIIRRIKQFKILKLSFLNSVDDKLNKVWKICCLINNFTCEPLVGYEQD